MSDSRIEILKAIREANAGRSSGKANPPSPPDWVPEISNRVERLQFEWERNGGEWLTDDANPSSLGQLITGFCEKHAPNSSIWCSEDPLVSGYTSSLKKTSFIAETHATELATAKASIATCVIAIAETGTIAVAASPEQPRSLTLLPESVLFLITANQVVGTLEQALETLRREAPQGWVWISGPSRTADIEKVLVKGIHGPKNVGILLLNN